MNKKFLVLISALFLLAFSMVGVTYGISLNAYSLYQDQNHVYYDEVLDSDTPTIYYYYQNTCHFCNSIKDQITGFTEILNETEGINMRLVDMKDSKNTPAWYDWKSHNKKYGENTPASLNPNYISDPAQMKTIEDIEITGTPTMIYVKNQQVVQYAVGADIFDILESVRDEYNIDYEFDRSKYGES